MPTEASVTLSMIWTCIDKDKAARKPPWCQLAIRAFFNLQVASLRIPWVYNTKAKVNHERLTLDRGL